MSECDPGIIAINGAGSFKWQPGDHVGQMSFEDKLSAAFDLAFENGYFDQALGSMGDALVDPAVLKSILMQAAIEMGLTFAGGFATGGGGIVAGGLLLRDGSQLAADLYELALEINDAYTHEMLDAAAKMLAEKTAGMATELIGNGIAKGGAVAGSASTQALKNLKGVPDLKVISGGDAHVDLPDKLPSDLQANANGGNGGLGAGNAQNGFNNASDPNLLPPGGKRRGDDGSDAPNKIPQTLSEVGLPARIRAAGGSSLREAGEFFGWKPSHVTKGAADFTRESLLAKGWTKERLLDVAEGYEHIARITPSNPRAAGRASQLREIAASIFGN